ncbi:MAG: 2,3-bisphosphoglycerate-dependent phosphoglycerate mutase, partial [Alphaproteobacteria bacterium]|nr:2,3-bisphosphoglycerate-dependent phosphoglycerate mutase [Alphaproteobacteria bacterium]
IKPHFAKAQNVLIVAHGNSLRALIMLLDGLAAKEIVSVEIGTGIPICYEMDAQGKALNKKSLTID